ncbi:unnamed protein product [Merluccius merluccius]
MDISESILSDQLEITSSDLTDSSSPTEEELSVCEITTEQHVSLSLETSDEEDQQAEADKKTTEQHVSLSLETSDEQQAEADKKRVAVTLGETRGEGPGLIPLALRTIMAIPPPRLLEGDEDSDKEKLCLDDNLDLGGSGMAPSASLTPAIWDKTIPYDGEDFHLEYMDLEEFLMENGIANAADLDDKGGSARGSPARAPEARAAGAAEGPSSPASLLPILDLDRCEEEEEEVVTTGQVDVASEMCTEVTTDEARVTPERVAPEDIEVDINFEPDHTDLVLSSVPGGALFNPRKHKFTDDELKPQPMIKKAKKVLVPDEKKDEKYWQRRNKNNVAAKRSRDARRLKENQITVRAAFLERENTALRSEVAELRKECGSFKTVVTRYQAKYGPL